MAWRLRFIGRLFAVAFGTLIWLIVVPVIELVRTLTMRRPQAAIDEEQNVPVAMHGAARPVARP